MKRRVKLFKLVAFVGAFTLLTGLVSNQSFYVEKAEATQYLGDYDSYTYSGHYYDSINFDAAGGMNGALRQSLTDLIEPAGFYVYGGSGTTHLSTQLQSADEDPTNSNNMVYLYTRDSVTKNAASTWNREHVWPQSLSNGNWGEKKGGTDILHLRPTYQSTNSSRGNTPYGDNNKQGAKYYNNMLYTYTPKGASYFEPIDSVKGDVARIIMYVWTTYTGYSGYAPLNILSVFQSYDTLLRWHTLDKPDALEGNRNNYCEISTQKNRNPFVDHPELAWKIFGNEASQSIKSACMEAYPANGGNPIEPTGVTLNHSSTSLEIGNTLQLTATLEPSGATGQVVWSSNNSSVASVNNSGLVTARASGTATITATVGSLSANCVVTVPQGINYGTAENPLTITEAKAVLDITDTELTAKPLYVAGTVTSNTSFNSQYNNYDSIWMGDSNNNQSFELFRTKLSSLIVGDYTAENALQGCEVVAYGFGKIYNGKYQLCTSSSEPKNPQILSLTDPEATGITLSQDTGDLVVGETLTLTATLIPANSSSQYTWESSNEGVATVEDGVVTAVSAGTAIITAEVSDSIKAECTITVTGSNLSTDLEIATSIAVGDIIYLACDEADKQYYGPSGTGTEAYGTAVPYTDKPDINVYALKVVSGHTANSYAFKIMLGSYADKYLAWTSNNSLRIYNSIDDNSSWNVSFNNLGNATISNVADTNRVIWWNNSSPRFSCYTGKSHSGTYYYVQLWKIVTTGSSDNVNDYLNDCAVTKTLHATVTANDDSGVEEFIFKNLGYSNAQAFSSETLGYVTFSAQTSSGSNGPMYYTTGDALRIYGGNTFSISDSDINITKIEFTFVSGSYTGTLSADSGTYDDGVWTGNAATVNFTNSGGQARIKVAKVTYGSSEVNVSNVGLRFGGTISKNNWDAINANPDWTIQDYGVMLVKRNTLTGYGQPSIEKAYEKNYNVTIRNKGDGEAPHLEGNNYVFTARINITSINNYDLEFVASPFIVVNDKYYFLGETSCTVRELATEWLDADNFDTLSEEALTKIVQAQPEV